MVFTKNLQLPTVGFEPWSCHTAVGHVIARPLRPVYDAVHWLITIGSFLTDIGNFEVWWDFQWAVYWKFCIEWYSAPLSVSERTLKVVQYLTKLLQKTWHLSLFESQCMCCLHCLMKVMGRWWTGIVRYRIHTWHQQVNRGWTQHQSRRIQVGVVLSQEATGVPQGSIYQWIIHDKIFIGMQTGTWELFIKNTIH